MENSCDATKTSACTAKWKSLIEKLHKLKSFRLHTGNINNYVELKLKRFNNSAEELVECLNMMLKCLPDDTQIRSADGTLLLADKEHSESNQYERADLKITLKLFMETFQFQHIKDATQAVLEQLETDNIEQLIIAFPQSNASLNESEIDEKWLEEAKRIWKQAETELVAEGKVNTLGVADFQFSELRRFSDEVQIRPRVVHVYLEGCCVVPPELQQYAASNNIELLTHNDPRPFPLRDVFHVFCNSSDANNPVCPSFNPVWAARYTVWVRRRSIMAAKGFIVQFVSALEGEH